MSSRYDRDLRAPATDGASSGAGPFGPGAQPAGVGEPEHGPVGPGEGQPQAAPAGDSPVSEPPQLDRHARALIARIRKNWNDVEAIRALAGHYTGSGDYASLANLMEGWGDSLAEPRAAADAYVEAADALLMSGHGLPEARVLYERALTRDASHVQALDRVTRLLEEARDYERQKQVLKYVAYRLEQSNGSRQLLASVHYRLGQVYEAHFDEPRKAATLYRKAIDENPRLVTAISAARRLYLESGNHKTVSVLFEFEIEASPNLDDKHNLLLALGRHKRELCDDLDGAVLAFRRASKLVPSSLRALFGLAETLLARSERAESIAREADRQRAAEVFFHLAQTVPVSEALPYLQRALLVVPEHAQARAMFDALSGGGNRELREASRAAPARGSDSRPPQSRGGDPRRWGESSPESAAAEAWLQAAEPEPVIDELGGSDLVALDDDATSDAIGASPAGAAERRSGRAPSLPPQTFSPSPPRPSPPPTKHVTPRPAAPPVAAPRIPPPPPPSAPASPARVAPPVPDRAPPPAPGPARVPIEVNVGGTTDSNFYVDADEELASGGVFVATYEPLPVDTLASLTITLPGRAIARAYGRVVLTRDLMDAFSDHIPGMFVQFEAIEPSSMALIERFTRRRAPMFIEG
jgi:tetratricopeptide (TPR) repeat protein